MRTAMWVIVWIACVLAGVAVGWLAGYALWQLGFELIGSAVALVGAGVGGVMAFLAVLSRWERSSSTRA